MNGSDIASLGGIKETARLAIVIRVEISFQRLLERFSNRDIDNTASMFNTKVFNLQFSNMGMLE